MKKMQVIFVVLAIISYAAANVYGASDRCVVKESRGQTVVLECNKKSGNFKVNDKVKVKTARTK